MPTFLAASERPDLPSCEVETLKFWRSVDAFKTSYEISKKENRKIYTFYDGPPFATGLPHYGNFLSGTMKDVVTRYAHQCGHQVERRFGWDCHGLPVEYEVDKMLGIKHRQDVLDMGIAKYNEQCRSIVMRYATEWRDIVERMGRWIDFDNDYKTMEITFMESVWWVFKRLYDLGLVYRAFKVMPYSTACKTPLSNFEANLNYKDVSDPSIVVTFPSKSTPGVEYLAWTTTPWTLPSNLALCVHPTMTYVLAEVPKLGRKWILCEGRLPWLCRELKLDVEIDVKIVDTFPGSTLAGSRYVPLFNYFCNPEDEFSETGFRIVAADFVTDDAGTGVVHCAPAFGEEDNKICLEEKVTRVGGKLPCPVNDDGVFTSEVTDFAGMHVKDADKKIRHHLKDIGRLLVNGEFVHAYPHCWRSDTPLLYRAVPCWFVKVEELRQDLLANNLQTYWVPAAIKEKRFHNWLADARDWCISRNRFWGTPIPLWCSEDYSQAVCIGSLEELEKYTGRKMADIHRHFIDEFTVPDPRGNDFAPLRRVDEVFDCWFESGSMPYAQMHYPFENKAEFDRGYPADFICEGLDQTRGWFYTLMVLSTALFNKPPFKNVVVNGMVLAADGKKMSKRLKNYPDPERVINDYSADALRLYLVSSPVVRGESLRFKEEGVKDIVKDVLLPWYHAYRFLIQQTTRYESTGCTFTIDAEVVKRSGNIMDRWINSCAQHLVQYVRDEMEAYRLYTVIPRLLEFLDVLTNWYVRFNRERMRGTGGNGDDALAALCTLFSVLLTTCRLMAPFCPFISELFYQNLRRALPEGHEAKQLSVHFVSIPVADLSVVDDAVEYKMKRMQAVINIGRAMRERAKVSLKTPLKQMTVIHKNQAYLDDVTSMQSYIREELNVIEFSVSSDDSAVRLSAVPNFKSLGTRLGPAMKKIQAAVKELTHEEIEEFEEKGSVTVCGEVLGKDDVIVLRQPPENINANVAIDGDNSVLVLLDFTADAKLQQMSLAREFVNRVQKLRKQLNLSADDPVEPWVSCKTQEMEDALTAQSAYIDKCLRRPLRLAKLDEESGSLVHREYFDINGNEVEIALSRNSR